MYTNSKCQREMLEAIKIKRELMINSANKKGFTSDETIRFSQELDILINQYQKASLHFSKPNKEEKFAFKKMIMFRSNVLV